MFNAFIGNAFDTASINIRCSQVFLHLITYLDKDQDGYIEIDGKTCR